MRSNATVSTSRWSTQVCRNVHSHTRSLLCSHVHVSAVYLLCSRGFFPELRFLETLRVGSAGVSTTGLTGCVHSDRTHTGWRLSDILLTPDMFTFFPSRPRHFEGFGYRDQKIWLTGPATGVGFRVRFGTSRTSALGICHM